jgi:predicted metal-binding membrane protein
VDPINEAAAGQSHAGPRRRRPERLIACLVAVALAAWIVTARTMGGMDAGPGTPLGPLPVFVAAWVLMLAAMMLPAELRFALVFARMRRDESPAAGAADLVAFVAGYFLVWTGYGVAAWLVDAALRELAPDFLAWNAHGPVAAGLVVVAAGLFQFSRWKQACLTHCVSPFGFFTRHWHTGLAGAARLGITHGIYCIGCCWALMAVMFAVGVMSLYWMSLLTLAMFVEKIAPFGLRLAPIIGLTLVVLGVFLAVDPASVPGLTLPDRSIGHSHGGSLP